MRRLRHKKTELFAQVYIASEGHIQSFNPHSLGSEPTPLIITVQQHLEQGNTNENRRQVPRTQRQVGPGQSQVSDGQG